MIIINLTISIIFNVQNAKLLNLYVLFVSARLNDAEQNY